MLLEDLRIGFSPVIENRSSATLSEAISQKKRRNSGLEPIFPGTPQVHGAMGPIHCTTDCEVDGRNHVLIIANIVGMCGSGGNPELFTAEDLVASAAASCLNAGSAC